MAILTATGITPWFYLVCVVPPQRLHQLRGVRDCASLATTSLIAASLALASAATVASNCRERLCGTSDQCLSLLGGVQLTRSTDDPHFVFRLR